MHSAALPHDRILFLDLSVETLWIARVILDALDVALEKQCRAPLPGDAGRLHALRINRDVFERLGTYGCSAEHVSPWSMNWSAASRVELIRQVGVHWRAFLDASFGTPVGMELIKTLTDREVALLEQIQKFGRTLQQGSGSVLHCMEKEMDALAERQKSARAMRRASYKGAVPSKR